MVLPSEKQKPPGGGFAPRVERGVSGSIMRVVCRASSDHQRGGAALRARLRTRANH
jgi:hypothetical protein